MLANFRKSSQVMRRKVVMVDRSSDTRDQLCEIVLVVEFHLDEHLRRAATRIE